MKELIRIFVIVIPMMLALVFGGCSPMQRTTGNNTMNGYCVFTFIHDTVGNSYYPKKSVFIDSATNTEFSLITPANLESYFRHCGRRLQTPIQKSEPYFDIYTFSRDSAFMNVFLEGNFYSDIKANNFVYAVIKIKGNGLVISKACKKYLNDHLVNNWNLKHAEICHDFLKLPQVYLDAPGTGVLLTENEKLRLGIKDIDVRKIRYSTCL